MLTHHAIAMKMMMEMSEILLKVFNEHRHLIEDNDLGINIDTLAEYYDSWKKGLAKKKDMNHLQKLLTACQTHVSTGDKTPGKTIRDSSADYIGSLLGFDYG